MRTALRMSRIPSYTRRDASINSFSSTGSEGFALKASTADSTCSVNRGMTAEGEVKDRTQGGKKKEENNGESLHKNTETHTYLAWGMVYVILHEYLKIINRQNYMLKNNCPPTTSNTNPTQSQWVCDSILPEQCAYLSVEIIIFEIIINDPHKDNS